MRGGGGGEADGWAGLPTHVAHALAVRTIDHALPWQRSTAPARAIAAGRLLHSVLRFVENIFS